MTLVSRTPPPFVKKPTAPLFMHSKVLFEPSNQTKTIGIVIISHSFYHLFFSSMLAGIFSTADVKEYGVLICETNQDDCQTGRIYTYT